MPYTLSDLEIQIQYEEKKKEKNWFRKFISETKLFIWIFTIIFLSSYLVTNAQLIKDKITDQVDPTVVQTISNRETSISNNLKSAQAKTDEINEIINLYWEVVSIQKDISPTSQQVLNDRFNNYDVSFNILPPTQRLIIPTIGINTPIVQTKIKDYNDFIQWNFETELENWVLKYPTSPNPGQWWNTLIFGHTSQEYRKYNKYGTVFRNIPSLKAWDEVQLVRWWELFTYKIISSDIISPKKVEEYYQNLSSSGKDSVTLIGCYPIWRADKRMVIYAERVY